MKKARAKGQYMVPLFVAGLLLCAILCRFIGGRGGVAASLGHLSGAVYGVGLFPEQPNFASADETALSRHSGPDGILVHNTHHKVQLCASADGHPVSVVHVLPADAVYPAAGASCLPDL